MEQEQGMKFYTAYLNNLKVLIKLYDCVLYREHFISLPGDEAIEKRHLNVRYLMAMVRKEDISKQIINELPSILAMMAACWTLSELKPHYGLRKEGLTVFNYESFLDYNKALGSIQNRI